MNLLASGVHEPAAVIDVIDCSGHMSLGGKKDASYIANLFLPWFRKMDPRHELIDLVYFDGASNVQKAGKVLSKFYPHVTYLHGAEHVVSLFFNDIFAMEPFHMLFNFHNKVSQLFVITFCSDNTCSYLFVLFTCFLLCQVRMIFQGVRHAPTAMFAHESRRHNNSLPWFCYPIRMQNGWRSNCIAAYY